MEIQDLPLWNKLRAARAPLSFEVELTARCNNDCRHCYINLPPGDLAAKTAELSAAEILDLAEQATGLGAVWCALTGGEPLLRDDFEQIFMGLKRLGLLVGVLTNACLVTPSHAEMFKRYPPRDVEVTVYGATPQTYEAVTRRPGSFAAFERGLALLVDAGVKVRLKAMALRSNLHEFDLISRFCRDCTEDYYRFDPLLHLRFDGDPVRNAEIRSERLSPAEVAALEQADEQRRGALLRSCAAGDRLGPDFEQRTCDHLFHCGAGESSLTIGHDGTFRLCGALCYSGTVYDLRRGTLREAWREWVPRVRDLRSSNPGFLENCRRCALIDLCLWCPAHAALESGALDEWVEYFCEVAHARAEALRHGSPVEAQGAAAVEARR